MSVQAKGAYNDRKKLAIIRSKSFKFKNTANWAVDLHLEK